MKKGFALILMALIYTMVFTGCGSVPTPSSSADSSKASQIELHVFAAASLTESLKQIMEMYKSIAPDTTIVLNLDSSGTLKTQIEQGADVDIFISAAQKQMDALEETGSILNETRKDLLINKVVLIVPENSEKEIQSFQDCTTNKVKLIALGNSDVPVGTYSEEIFIHLGVWDEIKSKTSFGNNVKQVLSQVESGSVDCGVVYATDVSTASGVTVVASAPEGSHSPVVYPAALLKTTQNKSAAQRFLEFLSEEDAATAFKSVGFTVAE
jgi:molybdate transport system substrate-binding protein